MSDFAILKGHEVVRCDLHTWAKWFEAVSESDEPMSARYVGKTDVDDTFVSTVFIGTDYQRRPAGPPLWFETMVFRGPLDDEVWRWSTWEEAEEGHAKTVARVQQAQGVSPN